MDQSQALETIRRAVREVAPDVDASLLDLPTRFGEVGLDSVKTLELVGAVEEAAGVCFSDDAVTGLQTVRELAELLGVEYRVRDSKVASGLG
jgi:acyl carrier protein